MPENIELIKKSYKSIEVDVTVAAAVTKAYFMVKNSLSDADASALASLTITGTGSASGQITVAGPTVATLKFYVSETLLDAVNAGDYFWSIKCISNSHAYSPPEGWGMLKVLDSRIAAVS